MSVERVHRLQVRTPEGVTFSYQLASPVLRLAGLAVDMAAVLAVWGVLSALIKLISVLSEDVAGLVSVVAYFLLTQGYHIMCEWRWRGQSLGKRLLRLRVIDEGGRRLSFVQVAMRNLLRFLDGLPMLYLVGGVAALASRRGQRLGDLVAGTLVVWEPPLTAPDFEVLRSGKYNSIRAHMPVVARLRQAVTPEVARAAWQALARRDEMEDASRVRLFAELAAYFQKLTPIPPEAAEGVSDEQFVRNVVEVLYVNRA